MMPNRRAVSAWQMTCDQRRPILLMKNFPMKADGASVRATTAKLTNWLPARFSTFIWPPM